MELEIRNQGGGDAISRHVQNSGLNLQYKTSKTHPTDREQDRNNPAYYLETLIGTEHFKELLQHA